MRKVPISGLAAGTIASIHVVVIYLEQREQDEIGSLWLLVTKYGRQLRSLLGNMGTKGLSVGPRDIVGKKLEKAKRLSLQVMRMLQE
ncbi:MAG: hypothetical protein ACOX44_12965 [Limnochordia bacterium]|jgi:hypothetical protein